MLIFSEFIKFKLDLLSTFPTGTSYMSIISENIKYLRNLNRLTQEQFSSRIGIKRSLLGAYEEARANPPLDKLKLIAQSFGVSVDALIKQDIRRMRETPDITLGFEKRDRAPIPEPRKVTELLDELLPAVKKEETPSPRVSSSPPPPVVPSPPPAEPYVAVRPQEVFTPGPTQGPTFTFPGLMGQANVKTFEGVADFPIADAWVVGEPQAEVLSIPDGQYYVLMTRPYGLIYRRVYNQVKSKGNFLLVSDLDGISPREVDVKDIQEAWLMKGYFVWQIPPPAPSLTKLTELVEALQFELDRIKKK